MRQKTSPEEHGASSKEGLTRRGMVSMAMHVLPARRMQILGAPMSAANLMVSERGAVTLSPVSKLAISSRCCVLLAGRLGG